MTTPAPKDERLELVKELRGFAEGSESARASLMRDAASTIESLVGAEKRGRVLIGSVCEKGNHLAFLGEEDYGACGSHYFASVYISVSQNWHSIRGQAPPATVDIAREIAVIVSREEIIRNRAEGCDHEDNYCAGTEMHVGSDGLTDAERDELARRQAIRRPSLEGRRRIQENRNG